MWAGPSHHYLAILPLSDEPVHYLAGEGLERELLAWSPDGTAIVYVSQYGQELWLYEPDLPERAGQNPRMLYAKGSLGYIFLAWPGRRIRDRSQCWAGCVKRMWFRWTCVSCGNPVSKCRIYPFRTEF